MTIFRGKSGLVPNLALVIFLVTAQSLVSTHALEHDANNPQNQVCTTCVAASQLGSATVDWGDARQSSTADYVLNGAVQRRHAWSHSPEARQRAPPASL